MSWVILLGVLEVSTSYKVNSLLIFLHLQVLYILQLGLYVASYLAWVLCYENILILVTDP